MNLFYILESFFDETQIAGYSLSTLLEYWWIGAIIVGAGGAAVAATGIIKGRRNPAGWKKMSKWLIPTVAVTSLVIGAGASFLPTNAYKNLLTTASGSHFVIYDTETRYCIYDVNYVLFEKEYYEDNPIVAVISQMRINQDPKQHPSDIKNDFDKVNKLIIKEL